MKRILFLGILFFLCNGVFAISGVNPVSYNIDFEPGLNKNFTFDFVLDSGIKADLEVSGPLSEYVFLDKSDIIGREDVVAILSLPESVKNFGMNDIVISAKKGDKIYTNAFLKVRVPYPEKYIELKLDTFDINVGDEAEFKLKAFNRGSVNASVYSVVQIFKDGEEIDTFDFTSKEIAPLEFQEFKFFFDATNYTPGDYVVVASGDYGGSDFSMSENEFRVGYFFVGLSNYTRNFIEGKIQNFDIEVENFWNGKINDFYVEVDFLGYNFSFITPNEVLLPFSKKTVRGFFDAKGIIRDSVRAKVLIHYGDNITSKIVELKAVKQFDYFIFVYIFVGFLIVLFLGWRIYIFVKSIIRG